MRVRDRREAILSEGEARVMGLDMKCKPTDTPEIGLPALREKYR